MSPPRSGIYQSRLFRSIRHQVQQLSDRLGVAWRRTKLVAGWTAQVAVYPLYALFQGARFLGSVLQASELPRSRLKAGKAAVTPSVSVLAPPTADSSVPPPADTPVQHLLLALRQLPLGTSLPVLVEQMVPLSPVDDSLKGQVSPRLLSESPSSEQAAVVLLDPAQLRSLQSDHTLDLLPSTPSGMVETPYIRGIASLLDSQALVLVTNHNQVLDILTTEQQDWLSRQIIWEIANYWRYWRRRLARQAAYDRIRIPSQKRPVFPIVRAFYRLIAWMQAGDVAISVNLFREAELVIPENPYPADDGLAIAASEPLLPITPMPNNELVWVTLPANITLTVSEPPAGAIASDQLIADPTADLVPAFVPVATTHTSDYIDTRASFVGYILSPIERCLHWVDRLFVWLETLLVNLWKRLTRLL